MIDVDDIVVDDNKTDTTDSETEGNNDIDVAVIEPQPIIEESENPADNSEILTAHINPDELPLIDIEPVIYGETDDWNIFPDSEDFNSDPDLLLGEEVDIDYEDMDESEDLYADGDDSSDDPDILDDILA